MTSTSDEYFGIPNINSTKLSYTNYGGTAKDNLVTHICKPNLPNVNPWTLPPPANPAETLADMMTEDNMKDKPALRLVRVVIVDTNKNLNNEDKIIHFGDEELTDATDEELYFALDINDMLKQHNAVRVKVKDKEASKNTQNPVYLEPARIRDITMSVVTMAEF